MAAPDLSPWLTPQIPQEHLQPPFSPVQQGLAEIDAAGPSELSSDRLRDDLRWFTRQQRALEAMHARWLAEADRRQEKAMRRPDDSCSAWLQDTHHVTPSAAYARVRTARQLEGLPRTAAALRAGDISSQHASIICRALGQIGKTRLEPSSAEGELLEAARRMDTYGLERFWSQLRYQADQEAGVAAERAQQRRSWLGLWEKPYGGFRIEGDLTTEDGVTLRTAVRAMMARHPRDDDRTPAERRAAAVGELARRALDAGELPVVGGERPHVMLVAELSTLKLEPGSRMAAMDWGPLVSGHTARRIAEDADVTPVLVDGRGGILHVGRRTRTVSPRMRRALNLRDRRCQAPGCEVVPELCIPHHLRHWADGGPTELSNLELRCTAHHARLHPENDRFRKGAAVQPAAP